MDGWNILIDEDDMETLDRSKAYEKEHEEIKVGDVVLNGQVRGIVTAIYENESDKQIDILMQSGAVALRCYLKNYKKTGKHIDISGLLAEIGGAK